MPSRKELTREIDRSPSDPKIAAFFDVDRTLLAGFSAMAFMKDRFAEDGLSLGEMAKAVAGTFRFGMKRTSFPSFLEETSTDLVGLTRQELQERGERVFARHLITDIYPESRALVEAHQRRGHTVAIVSSATHFQIDALAEELGIEHVLCTELEFDAKGRFTGKVARPACYQEGKANAASAFAAEHDVDLSQSYFYTDSHDDVSLLDLVGQPRLVNPDPALARVGSRRGWPVYQFSSRGRPGSREIAGLVGSLASLGPAALVGLPAAIASGSLRKGADLMLSTYSELTTTLTGVELNVEGEEHLWSARPAVFIFNHQSGLDSLLMAQLTQRDVVGVAKKELETTPIIGSLMKAAGVVFVDRGHKNKAIEAMQPAVEAMRAGLSVVIAPEGTRSPTRRIGKFKKGAFHMAMAAGVPIVPVVIKNALDALPRHGIVIRPTTVDIVVHPPIPTSGWKREDLDDHIAEIEALYEETLKD
ncbi:MAG: HAD-IB family hydrolase [Deltaproteobacteria bacterium]|jgi:putative phosphoserine phosphatase/1-acylglycerol-3-phosphate O-acyltransferase|nr:HAD-IB family hydrolase [Deltaproteobacteria bacterium]